MSFLIYHKGECPLKRLKIYTSIFCPLPKGFSIKMGELFPDKYPRPVLKATATQ